MRLPRPIVLLILALPAALAAQLPDSLSLRGRHMLTGSLGLTGTREASASPGQTTARATGPVAALSYTYFPTPRIGIEIDAAVLDADASTSYANNRGSAVTAFLFGFNFAPRSLALNTTVRPYFSAAVGSYSHHLADVSGGGTTQARTQSQAGARVGAGINFFVARHFAMRIAGEYHAVQPFDEVNGIEKDVSGFGLSFGLALTWGGR